MLARARWLPEARDNEARGLTRYGRRPHAARDELGGKTLLIVGSTDRRPARVARHGVRHARDRHPPRPARRSRTRGCGARNVRPQRALPQVDFVALTCPLTSETQNLIDADALRHEAARVSSQCGARSSGRRAGARRRARATADQGCRARRHGRGAAARGLAAVAMENVLITPHTAVR